MNSSTVRDIPWVVKCMYTKIISMFVRKLNIKIINNLIGCLKLKFLANIMATKSIPQMKTFFCRRCEEPLTNM